MTAPRVSMIGKRFDMLIVIKTSHQSGWGDWRYICKCDCGKKTEVGGANLRKGAVRSCGCLRFKPIKPKTRFGMLEVTRKNGLDKFGATKYLCRCDCGKNKTIRGYSLRRGDSQSCGCRRGHNLFKHGMSGTRDYALIKNHRRYAKKLGAKGSHTAEQVAEKLKAQDHRCYYCSVDIRVGYHRDHMTPLIRGGSDDISNIALTCPSCNLRKNTMTPEEFMEKKIL